MTIQDNGKFHFKLLAFVSMILIFEFSCKKEKPDDEIVIDIQSPGSGFSGHFLDSVHILATVHSSSLIKSISISVVDNSGISVSSGFSTNPNLSDYVVDQYLILNNNYVPTGDYSLVISASDENTNAKKGVSIHLNELPKKTEAIYLLSTSNNLSFNIYKLDSTGLIFQKNIAGDYQGSAISSRNHQLYSCGRTTGNLNYFNIADFNNFFNVPPINPINAEAFTSYYFSDELNFTGLYDGSIKAYDESGVLQFSKDPDAFFIPRLLLRSDIFLIAELESAGTHQNNISVINYPSGIGRQMLSFDFDIISMFEYSSDKVLLFAMRNGQAFSYFYSINSNGANNQKQFGALVIKNVSQISPSDYLLVTDHGLKKYNLHSGTATTVNTANINDIEYDEVNNVYYCYDAHNIHVLNGTNLVEDTLINSVDSIMAIRVLYSK